MQRSYQNQQQRGYGFRDFLATAGLAALIFKYIPLGIFGLFMLPKVGQLVNENSLISRCSAEAQLMGASHNSAESMCRNMVRAGIYTESTAGIKGITK